MKWISQRNKKKCFLKKQNAFLNRSNELDKTIVFFNCTE